MRNDEMKIYTSWNGTFGRSLTGMWNFTHFDNKHFTIVISPVSTHISTTYFVNKILFLKYIYIYIVPSIYYI